ncbi:hypothetical protein CIB95_12195 [Lottiidibacillus patelloidae]|uniref:Uncharacterized protein n=1 Tax=Lottiidibacillus patelloidae TaxID=2670334 RepID=A0A263BS49_9BACI|nr:DUF3931 domain-containing protein [Lottiidibacillus patelloidae]OZM56525.1 hypothetical protein CIB95_12195 [Lottiidibacillus patelloidae]
MSNDKKKPTVISFDGKKKQKKTGATIEVDGEKVDLGSFVLSGEDTDGKRVVYTWNCSPDEMCAFTKTMEVLVTNRLSELMDLK